MAVLTSLLLAIADLGRALWHVATGRRRARYAAHADIAASRAAVWDLLTRDSIQFAHLDMRIDLRPIPDRPGGHIGIGTLNGREISRVAYQVLERRAAEALLSRYLDDPPPVGMQVGDDDHYDMLLSDGPDGLTRLTLERELTHRSFATRVVAPLQLRAACDLMKRQAEHEAGRVPANASASWSTQLVVSVIAAASFVWLFGLDDALIIMAIIAIHEAGHALAMLRYGLGVRVASFVPFFGGVAISKRPPASEWQAIVIALMGVGVSLPVSYALYAHAAAEQSATFAHAAALFAVINAVNLLPFPALDGGQVTSILTARISPQLSRYVMWGMFAAFVVLAALINSPLVWIVVALSGLVVVTSTSIGHAQLLLPLTKAQAVGSWALFLSLMAAYAVLAAWSIGLEVDLALAAKRLRQ